MYRGYKIKLDLKLNKVRFYNYQDDCVFNLFNKKSNFRNIEQLTRNIIDKRINYLERGK